MLNVKYTDSACFRCLENLRETSLELTLIHTGKENCKPSHVFSGIREEYIIHFVLSGSGFYSVNESTWHLEPGQMFLIYPGDAVTYGADEHNPWTYAWIGIRGMRVDSILKECGFSRTKLIQPAPSEKNVMECIDNMLDHKELTTAGSMHRESSLLKLLALLMEHHAELSRKKGKQEKYTYSSNVYVGLAIDFIHCMYNHNIGVTDIAENIGISRAHLNQCFQKELNLSVQKFLIDYRMHKAANLLLSTEMSVKEISNLVGYDDQLTFSKAFKKKFGMSPKNYKAHTDEMDKFNEKQPDKPGAYQRPK